MAAIGLGTVLANIFGFLVIENMSVGFSVIAMDREDKEEVGFMYQKTMGINFFVCILVTPILYLSDRFLKLIGFNEELVDISSNYLWALVPSFYLYAFYETTKNYLQSQGVIYPCLVIGTCCSVLHYIIAKFMIDDLGLGIMGAAWSKNISFLCSSLILYLYIIKQEPARESWIEWNIKATNDVHHFLGKIITHEIFTYYEVLAFQILGLVACYLWDPKHIAAHLAFSATLIILYFMHMGISHCVNKTLSISIAENDVRMGKKKIKLGICMSVILSIIIVANLWFNQDVLFIFFNQNHESVAFMKVVFNVFLLVALFDGLQITLLGVLKTLRIRQVYAFCLFGFYVIGVGGGILLAYKF
jgi:MATE family multidrug resistance protein